MTSEKDIAEPVRHTPVVGRPDVLVVGGGPAGIGAACSSARNGARTLLVERYGFPGGMATAGMVNCINGFRNQKGPRNRQAVAGIAEELIRRVAEEGGAHLPGGRIPYCVVVDPEITKRVAIEILCESGCELLMHTLATNPLKERGMVSGAITHSKSGRRAYRAKVVIDCTGDADMAAAAGAAYDLGRPQNGEGLRLQLMFRMSPVDGRRFAKYVVDHRRSLTPMYDMEPLESALEAVAADRPFGAAGLEVGEGEAMTRASAIVWRNAALLWAGRNPPGSGITAEELTSAEVESRIGLRSLVEKLRGLPGFEGARLEQAGSQVGVRETRHVRGEYRITEEDVLEGRRFDDSIAIGANPMACVGKRPILDHEGFEIPYRSLLPEELEGILLAGRCISATHEAHGSVRAMATCMATGQAAGTAAALAVETDEIPRLVSIPTVQKRLGEQGAIPMWPR